ncbi:STING domain-containing protein [Cyclobacterium marinum]|uniref:STING domain-containing protein n=1 Tax=Cyclobacterium marinum TaxID=104 RepID=UPI0030D9772C|tara:strand:+ start:131937 stop:133013 length:1077 start_codon:yes stop_codon:yes gene_type:complete
MFKTSYFADQRLEIVILGPMRGEENDSSIQIRNALKEILQDENCRGYLDKYGVTEANVSITFPEEWKGSSIERDVFSKLDTADLVVFNITPRAGETNPSPNVFYELGLVHSLGLPYLVLVQDEIEIPFYLRGIRCYTVKAFEKEELTETLYPPIENFLSDNSPFSFTENIITRFYEGLPVVDISAAVGLATGYYMNFVRRILKDGGFISHYPDKIKRLIVVRPISIFNTYEEDVSAMKDKLIAAGYELILEKLAPILSDKDGGIWFEHINGTVIDIPRTIYPLKRSPRLLSLRKRMDQAYHQQDSQLRVSLLNEAAEKLVDKIESIIKYHIRNDSERVRESLLEFLSVDQLVDRIKQV